MPPQIETARLTLRPFTPDDADAAYAALEGHPDTWRYDPGYQRTREQRAALVQKYAAGNDPLGCGTLAIVVRETQVLIGYVGLQFYILPREPLATPEIELYYKLDRAAWGRGYAAEACRALIGFAFETLRLNRLVTITAQENAESIRLLERLGMRIDSAPPAWRGMVMGTLENQPA
jgi:ribosomal-protein-alanine N-acetyltransferase